MKKRLNKKICSKCKVEKLFEEFYKDKRNKNGIRSECKECVIQYGKQYRLDHQEEVRQCYKQYNLNHREERKQYRLNHREEKRQYSKQYRLDHQGEIRQREKQYRLNHQEERRQYNLNRREERSQYEKNKRKNDPQFRLSCSLRKRNRKALKGDVKVGSAVRDCGCSTEHLREHLEKQFKPGMTWENYGLYGWHIDHIKPLSSFDLMDRKQFLEAHHYTNLQPLWAEENLRKGNKII